MVTCNSLVIVSCALAGAVACTSPEPMAGNGANDANRVADVPVNNATAASSSDPAAPAMESEKVKQTKAPQSPKAAPPAKPRPPFQRSPTAPPAEVDPVRNVDITDPG